MQTLLLNASLEAQLLCMSPHSTDVVAETWNLRVLLVRTDLFLHVLEELAHLLVSLLHLVPLLLFDDYVLAIAHRAQSGFGFLAADE